MDYICGRSPLRPKGNVIVSHPVGSGWIPDQVNFLAAIFPSFSSTVRQMSDNLAHIRPGLLEQ